MQYRTNCGLKVQFQAVKYVVNIFLHGYDIRQGMDFFPAESAGIIAESFEDC